MRKWIFIITLALATHPTHSKILEYRTLENKKTKHSYKDVCSKMGYRDVLLIEKEGINKLDCMKAKVDISEYCSKVKEYTSDKVVKGRVDLINKGNVVCEYATAVTMKVSCDNSHGQFCRTHVSGCLSLKKFYAKDLDLMRSSIDKIKDQKVLNCQFISMKEEKLDELIFE